MISNIFLLLFILLNILVVYEDFKRGRIPNKYLLPLLMISIAHLFYLGKFNLRTIFISSFVSFLLWLVGFWPSGDAKLFIIYSIFLSHNLNVGVLEANVFVPFFFLFTPLILLKANRRMLIGPIKKIFSFYGLYILFSVFFGFIWLVMLIVGLFNVAGSSILYFLIALVMIEVINKITPFSFEVFYGILCVLRIFFDNQVYTLNFWLNFLKILAVYLALIKFPLEIALNFNVEEKRIEDLKVGDVPLEGIFLKDGKYVKKKISPSITVFSKRVIHSISDDGLTRDDIILLKKLKRSGEFHFATLKVYKPIPFAPFLFVGFLLTLLVGENFILMIKEMIFRVLYRGLET